MALFGNYDRPGRGVLKTPHEKTGFFKFWEIYFRHMWKLILLNMLYCIFLIPFFIMMSIIASYETITPESLKWLWITVFCGIMGPATAAMTRVARNFSQERPTFVGHDFFKAFKANLKQGLIMGYIDTLALVSFILGLPLYGQMARQNHTMYIPFLLCVIFMTIFFMMHFYIYPMMCSADLSLKQIIKNSLFLVIIGIKKTLFTFVAALIVVFVFIVFMPYSAIFMLFLPFSFICFTACYNCYPVIRKHVIQPYYDQRGEENPETARYEADEDEMLFEDKAAEEIPVARERSAKRKTIR